MSCYCLTQRQNSLRSLLSNEGIENLRVFSRAMGRKHALESDKSQFCNFLTVQFMSLYASVSSSVKSRFYLPQLGLDLAVNSGFKKRHTPPFMEHSRSYQHRIHEVALINKVLRGQVSCVLMAFIPLTSRLKMAVGIPAIMSVFQF